MENQNQESKPSLMELAANSAEDVYLTGNPVLMYGWTRKPKGPPDENGRQIFICTYIDPTVPYKCEYEYVYQPKK